MSNAIAPSAAGARVDRAAARETLARHGYAVLRAGAVAEAELADPWRLVESLVGERPLLLERQPIRPIPHGRSFASTDVFTPLHTDSQQAQELAPQLQVMFCRAPAAEGGETLLVDGWEVIARIEREDPATFRALFETVRDVPFYFGSVVTPTVARHGEALVITASPMIERLDVVGRAFASAVERTPRLTVAVLRGETLLVDNHRMLHGRHAFAGPEREFTRLLCWLTKPFAVNDRHAQCARTWGPAREARDPLARRRLGVVLEMLTGVPPAKLAAREGITEAELYRWRDAALSAATRALG